MTKRGGAGIASLPSRRASWQAENALIAYQRAVEMDMINQQAASVGMDYGEYLQFIYDSMIANRKSDTARARSWLGSEAPTHREPADRPGGTYTGRRFRKPRSQLIAGAPWFIA